MTSSLGPIHLLEQLTELTETLHLQNITQEQRDGRDAQGKVWGKGAETP